ncbi:hypothetical protein AB1Y20_015759 [Prymnesium parvum]|uniref:RXYLT1 C-terminal domain-containing protein n=1 Tax=Prymnesium parvum TaxID=97485 RepID=A0AB34JYN9_PRYPA
MLPPPLAVLAILAVHRVHLQPAELIAGTPPTADPPALLNITLLGFAINRSVPSRWAGHSHSLEYLRRISTGAVDGALLQWEKDEDTVVEEEDFLRRYLPYAQPNWVVYVHASNLMEQPELLCRGGAYGRGSSFGRALLAHPTPLTLVVQDSCCNLADVEAHPQHTLFRNVFNDRLEARWEAGDPSLRDFPYGTNSALKASVLAELQQGKRKPSDRRAFLLTFTGHNTGSWTPRGYRCQAAHAFSAVKDRVELLAERVMSGRPLMEAASSPTPTNGSKRVFFKLTEGGTFLPLPNCTAPHTPYGELNLNFTTLVTESVFGLAPPGDVWESYRLWELIEAGTIPIVQRTQAEEYAGCKDASSHVLKTMDGVLYVDDYAELPALLERVFANGWSGVLELQARLRKSYDAVHQRVRRSLAKVAQQQ